MSSTRPERPLISVVVPVYIEEETVHQFHTALLEATADADFDLEILFIDDGSTDNTFAELERIHAKDPRVRVLRFSRNYGSYAAITAGFHHASGDAIVAISVDLQDPPSLIPQYVAKWREGYDIVWGTRDGRDDPFFKSLYASLFYGMVRRFAFKDFPNDGMDSGLFDRRVIDVYRALPERNNIPFFTLYSLGFRQARIPYKREARKAGFSKWPFWKRVRAALDVMVGYSYAPIRLITVMGLISAGLAFLYGLFIIANRLLGNQFDPGWSSVMVAVLFIGGVQMIMLGIVAEYIYRNAEIIRARPRYIIMEQVGEPPAPRTVPPLALDPLNLNVSTAQHNGNGQQVEAEAEAAPQ